MDHVRILSNICKFHGKNVPMVIWVLVFLKRDVSYCTLHNKLICFIFSFSGYLFYQYGLWGDYLVCRMANWCRKCIYLKPKLEKLAADYYPRWDYICFPLSHVTRIISGISFIYRCAWPNGIQTILHWPVWGSFAL